MRSVLPPALEEKRLAIAGAHNTIAIIGGTPLILGMFVGIFIQGRKTAGNENDVGIVLSQLLPVFVPVFIGLVLIAILQSWNDRRLCRQLGFVCDRCGRLLYPSNAFLTGVCPSCGEKLTAKPLTLGG